MEFRIENLDKFKIIDYKITTTSNFMKAMRDCPSFWKKIIKEQKNELLLPFINIKPLGLIGASVYNIDSKDDKKFDYYIAVASNEETPDFMEEYIVPEMTWAVFSCTKKSVGKTQMKIVKKWEAKADYLLLKSGYSTGKMVSVAPDLEVYGQGDKVEIWIPVKRK